MKVKVIRQYVDKYTRNLHKVGEVLTMSKERYEEINSTSRGIFVEEIVEEIKQPKKTKSTKK